MDCLCVLFCVVFGRGDSYVRVCARFIVFMLPQCVGCGCVLLLLGRLYIFGLQPLSVLAVSLVPFGCSAQTGCWHAALTHVHVAQGSRAHSRARRGSTSSVG